MEKHGNRRRRLMAGILAGVMALLPGLTGVGSDSSVLIAYADVTDESSQVDFDTIRAKWQALLTGGNLDMSKPEVQSYVSYINTSAEKLYEGMNKRGG